MLRMPTAGTPYDLVEIARATLGLCENDRAQTAFSRSLKKYLDVENLILVNSGTTACYLLLELFKKIRISDKRNEIILPAYTAPSLLLPIRAAGLNAVLVDTDPDTFNIDIRKIRAAITPQTLAIMPVHMFGLPVDIAPIVEAVTEQEIFIIEDAASSLGSVIGGRQTGAIAPFGFYSLNRGKNVSTLAGGIIVWKEPGYTALLKDLAANLPPVSHKAEFLMWLRFLGLSMAVRPLGYTALAPILAKFKYTTLHTHFDSFAYTDMQAALGKILWRRIEQLTNRRVGNGLALMRIFAGRPGFTTPTILPDAMAAFNQFPVIVHDLGRRQRLQEKLLKIGIETTLMYEKPLHYIFPELNPRTYDNFPQATYLAEHLLLIPPHTQIGLALLKKIKTIVEATD
ncbi:MAG: DegT/DnrJ/EryC1/StrS family aminotransferase [Candidatus Marinimicrobia bacterium]|nr:DegT/DnrJ/EryC1/StrS family aminotransferase [Candidatus Neomarinimicrobiota bacterium]